MGLPPELQALMGGGGGAAPQGGGLPPELEALMGGGGAPPEMQAPAEEAPPGALHGGGAAEGDPETFYREALDSLEAGMKSDTDENRINLVLKSVTQIQGSLAAGEKGMDAMLGGKLDPAQMRRMGSADQAY